MKRIRKKAPENQRHIKKFIEFNRNYDPNDPVRMNLHEAAEEAGRLGPNANTIYDRVRLKTECFQRWTNEEKVYRPLCQIHHRKRAKHTSVHKSVLDNAIEAFLRRPLLARG